MTAHVGHRVPTLLPHNGELPGVGAPVSEWAAVASCPRRLLIGGEWREARGERTLTVNDPATGPLRDRRRRRARCP